MRSLSSLLARARRSVLLHNAVALYGVHAAGLILPLITVPYLARVLRPDGWGLVVFAQAFAAWLALVVEYGFHLSATRLVARQREDRQRLGEVVADVLGAKGILVLIAGVLALVAYAAVPTFRGQPEYLLWGYAVAVAQGLSPMWYFQGVEQMRAPAALEVSARLAATLGIFVWVDQPGEGWLVLALQALAGIAWSAIATAWIYRDVPFMWLRVRGAMEMLRGTADLFVFRGASGVYTQANSFILGLVAAPQAVAFYGGAERIIRAVIGLIQPASHAIYPRISHLVGVDREHAGRLLRLSLVLVGGLGLVMGIVVALLAPLLVRVLLGPGYEAAVEVLRLLALLAPVIALGTVLGIQWALPMGLDRPFCALVVAAGALNLGLAFLLVPHYGAIGMAVSVILAEATVMLGLLLLATWKGNGVWWSRPRLAPLAPSAEPTMESR